MNASHVGEGSCQLEANSSLGERRMCTAIRIQDDAGPPTRSMHMVHNFYPGMRIPPRGFNWC
jgi:hypothetical protein